MNGNQITSITELVEELVSTFKQLLSSRKWFTLSILLAALVFILFAPEQGIMYPSISEFITDSKQYTAIFLTAFLLIFAINIIIYVYSLFRRAKKWIKWSLFGLLLLLLFSTTIVFTSRLKSFPNSIEENLSYGEKSLFIKGSPEQEIYKRNKQITGINKNYLNIAVSVPISVNNGADESNEFLRGVVIAQDEWNRTQKDLPVVILIADDGYKDKDISDIIGKNEKEKKAVQDIAFSLTKQRNVLAVVGHSGSDVTQAAAPIYKKAKLVAVSPTSTAKRKKNSSCNAEEILTKKDSKEDSICLNEFIFRTAINDDIASEILVRAIIDKNNEAKESGSSLHDNQISKFVIVYDVDSTYSQSFKSAFEKNVNNMLKTGEDNNVIPDDGGFCNLANVYQENKCLEFIKENKPDAVLFIPGEVETALKLDGLIDKVRNFNENILFLGSDTMYQQNSIVKKAKPRVDTEGMIIPITWHRKDNLNICQENSSELECKAAKIFDNKNQSGDIVPSLINWRTATSYDATKAILEGLKIAKENHNYCGGGLLKLKRFAIRDCMREKLKDVLVSGDFRGEDIKGAKATIKFSGNNSDNKVYGERETTDGLGVVVVAKNGSFHRFKDF